MAIDYHHTTSRGLDRLFTVKLLGRAPEAFAPARCDFAALRPQLSGGACYGWLEGVVGPRGRYSRLRRAAGVQRIRTSTRAGVPYTASDACGGKTAQDQFTKNFRRFRGSSYSERIAPTERVDDARALPGRRLLPALGRAFLPPLLRLRCPLRHGISPFVIPARSVQSKTWAGSIQLSSTGGTLNRSPPRLGSTTSESSATRNGSPPRLGSTTLEALATVN